MIFISKHMPVFGVWGVTRPHGGTSLDTKEPALPRLGVFEGGRMNGFVLPRQTQEVQSKQEKRKGPRWEVGTTY